MIIIEKLLHTALLVGLGSLANPAVANAEILPASASSPSLAAIPVRDHGLVATWYPPTSGRKSPAIIVLGGSEGGEEGGQYLGKSIAKHGYGVLSVAYFGAEGLPANQQEVPLEYFDTALAWLAAQPMVDRKRIGIYGISVGAETALVVAARHPEIKAVVAAVPSSVVWQGINMRDFTSIKSTYSLAGKPVPFVPYDNSKSFTSILDLYQRSLAKAVSQDAVIPVERIGGPILLLSAKDDRMWPSTMMAEQVVARLESAGFKPFYEHIAYADAGHGAMSPPSGDATMAQLDNLGGTKTGNQAARMDMWRRVVDFFATSLGKAGK